MGLAGKGLVPAVDAVLPEGVGKPFGLVGGDDRVIEPLEEQHGAGDLIGMMDRRAPAIGRPCLGQGPHQGVDVSRLEVMGLGGQRLEIGDAVPGCGPGEPIGAHQCAQR